MLPKKQVQKTGQDCTRTPIEIDSATEQLTDNVNKASKLATPEIPGRSNREITYPMEIRELVKKKRKARKKWHCTRDPLDKTIWNSTCRLLHDKIKEVKNETFKSYLSNLSTTKDTDYSL
ncbi:hypothetical protein QTP88_026338 [Uroleucon formosanum]